MSYIPPPREPISGPGGVITGSWWRFFQKLMVAVGGNVGGPVTVTTVGPTSVTTQGPVMTLPQVAQMAQIRLSSPRSDSERRIADLEMQLAAQRTTAGRIADLEAKVDMLTRVLFDGFRRDDLNAIRRDLDAVLAYGLSTH